MASQSRADGAAARRSPPLRQVLVIASQHGEAPERNLPAGADKKPGSPAPLSQQLLFELYEQLIDSQAGGCQPATGLERIDGLLPVKPGLVINPTMEQAKQALEGAIDSASESRAVVVVYCVGGGNKNANELGGFEPYRVILERCRQTGSWPAGVVLIVDGGQASSDPIAVETSLKALNACPSVWVESLQSGDEYDGRFTRKLTEVLREGVPRDRHPELSLVTHLRVPDLLPLIEKYGSDLKAGVGGYQRDDAALYVARNRTAERVLTDLGLSGAEGDYLLRLLARYQPHQIKEVVAESRGHRFSVVIGDAGTGKSTLAAALRLPPVEAGVLSSDAVGFISLTDTPDALAETLRRQLVKIPQFEQASGIYERAHRHQWKGLSVEERLLIGPLRVVEQPIVLVIDALDQVDDARRGGIWKLIERLTTDEQLQHVRVIGTSRPDTDLPEHACEIRLAPLDDSAAAAYLSDRKVRSGRQPDLISLASGNWLMLELAAEYASHKQEKGFDEGAGLEGLYERIFKDIRGRLDWTSKLQPVLAVLCAARGSGGMLPYAIFADAVARLGGPRNRSEFYEVLSDRAFSRLIDRFQVGSAGECLGLFHPTLCEWLTASGFDVDLRGLQHAHLALYEAIRHLAPREAHDPSDPLHRYAMEAEAEHDWAGHRGEDTIQILKARRFADPGRNLNVWIDWQARMAAVLGANAAETLEARRNTAHWTAETGGVAEALRLFTEVLPDQERVLGPESPVTLATRRDIAFHTGRTGDAAEALRLFKQLLPDQERIPGPDPLDLLATRREIAHWTAETGDAAEALRLFKQLLPEQQRLLGSDSPEALTTRQNIAHWTAERGDAAGALHLFKQLLPDQERVLDPSSSEALATRREIAHWTAETGDAAEALRLFTQLLPDQERVLGPDSTLTLATRGKIAHWRRRTGDAAEALRLLKRLLPDQERVLGPGSSEALATRRDIAYWTVEIGNAAEALRLFKQLLPDQERVLGLGSPDALATRRDIAHWTAETGDAAEALRLFTQLLPDQERVLGPDSPDTLTTRRNIAHWTAQTGNAVEALHLFTQLLPDQERVLGPGSAEALATRRDIAHLTAKTGGAAEAQRLSTQLLPDQRRVLGPDSPDTLTTRRNIAHWTAEAGDAAGALRLFKQLLPDQQRVLGPDSPETLATRRHIAHWTAETGNAAGALRLFKQLLPHQERVLGPDSPATLATRRDIACWSGRTGDAAEAVRLLKQLLPDQERVLGSDSDDTQTTRHNLAFWTAKTTDSGRALAPVKPASTKTRHAARSAGNGGSAPEALRRIKRLLPDGERALGQAAAATLATRRNIAHWTAEAARVVKQLLPDQERLLAPASPAPAAALASQDNKALPGAATAARPRIGPAAPTSRDNIAQPRSKTPEPVSGTPRETPESLANRLKVAYRSAQAGDPTGALRLLKELLPDQQAVLGPDAPATLATRHNIASCTGQLGDADGALRLLKQLLPDQVRALGPDAPDTLATRRSLAHWTAETGDAAGALSLFENLLVDQQRVLGPDAPATLTTRHNIAFWTGKTGNAAGALQLFSQLLPDRERVLGPDAPATLTTRQNIAGWTAEAGDAQGAIKLFKKMLPDFERVLGPVAPATQEIRNNIAYWSGAAVDKANL